MVKPDLILTNPYGIEHPFWRAQMYQYQNLFNKIIVAFYQDNRKYDYREFIKSALPSHVIFLDAGVINKGDWRNVCVNMALPFAYSPWTLFLEQDFVPNDGFYEELFGRVENDWDVAAFADTVRTTSLQGGTGRWQHGVRIHPAFTLVRRELIEKTKKDFGAHPEPEVDRDHFGVFADDLYALKPRFFDLDEQMPGKWKHYASYYYNYMCVQAGTPPPYKPQEFREIVNLNLKAPVVQDPTFVEWSKKCLEMIP